MRLNLLQLYTAALVTSLFNKPQCTEKRAHVSVAPMSTTGAPVTITPIRGHVALLRCMLSLGRSRRKHETRDTLNKRYTRIIGYPSHIYKASSNLSLRTHDEK